MFHIAQHIIQYTAKSSVQSSTNKPTMITPAMTKKHRAAQYRHKIQAIQHWQMSSSLCDSFGIHNNDAKINPHDPVTK